MMIAYFIALAVTGLWTFAAGGLSSLREQQRSDTRRASRLRDAAGPDHASYGMLDTFRDPRRSPVLFVSEHWQQRWWCEKLDVTCDALLAAVQEVGPMTADIERHFSAAYAR